MRQNPLKTCLVLALEKFPAGRRWLALWQLRHHLKEIGWLRSAGTRESRDATGHPVPWYTYPAIGFLTPRVRRDFAVFEYGSGNSTLWWAARAGSVAAVEHDRKWYEAMREKLPANVEYRHCEVVDGGSYCRAVLDAGRRFDIIVIDGRDRVNCARHAPAALSERGLIIWDNSEREAYATGIASLRAAGFTEVEFNGLGPINPGPWRTSIFYRPGNCLGL